MRAVYVYRPGHPRASANGFVDTRDLDDLAPIEGEARVPVVTDRYMEGVRAIDGTDIGSRAKRREYMKVRGLADASDYTQHWEAKAKEREQIRTGTHEPTNREVRESVERAYYKLYKQ